MRLKDQAAIVTGAGRGIGRAIALAFGREGARVACVARTAAEVEETAGLIRQAGGAALAVPTDVTDEAAVAALVERVLREYGRIDVLVNNAGSFRAIGPVWEVATEDWWQDVTVNLRGPFLTCKHVLPHMIRRRTGRILNMSGGGAGNPFPGGSGYACSKAALCRLTDSLAREVAPYGILVVAFGPGLVRTRMTEFQAETEAGRRWIPSTKECFDSGRTRPPEDAARLAVMLASMEPIEGMAGRIFGPDDTVETLQAAMPDIVAQNRRVVRGT